MSRWEAAVGSKQSAVVVGRQRRAVGGERTSRWILRGSTASRFYPESQSNGGTGFPAWAGHGRPCPCEKLLVWWHLGVSATWY